MLRFFTFMIIACLTIAVLIGHGESGAYAAYVHP